MIDIAILPMVKKVMKNRHINGAELARQLQVHPTTVNGMLHRPTLQVNKLAQLSHLLQYNFFRELALQFPYAEPTCTDTGTGQENKELKNRVYELELEVKVLRQTIRDLAGK
ncbi:helix-turn-helix domain-containing protein [uncultured Draconibacterium sp.]|uniref:helix-turn-helix domain-containing protein n=1 Tax=uncultured Draconibacterium sp. TaxID=1573823 RepID=UPI003260CD79